MVYQFSVLLIEDGLLPVKAAPAASDCRIVIAPPFFDSSLLRSTLTTEYPPPPLSSSPLSHPLDAARVCWGESLGQREREELFFQHITQKNTTASRIVSARRVIKTSYIQYSDGGELCKV